MVVTRSSGGMATLDDLRDEIQQMNVNISARFNSLENNLAEQVKALVTKHINTVKTELTDMMTNLTERVAALEERPRGQPAPDDRGLNFVIYGLEESDEENVTDKVNNLVAAQLKLPEVKVAEAERKQTFRAGRNGVIVARCVNSDQKDKVMKAKSLLNTGNYRHISINHDKPKWQRQHEANLRLVIKTLCTNKLYLKGNRVCANDDDQNWQNAGNRGRGARNYQRGGGRGMRGANPRAQRGQRGGQGHA